MSHSCKDGLLAHPPATTDPVKLARLRFALDVRTALVKRLDPGGTGSVWFDRKRLEPGDEWEVDIVGALHTCGAAILLLTPDALESPWVLREATVLGDRRSRWPDLQLVPVLFAGTTHQTLAKHPWWAALNITRWQPVQATHGAFEGDDAKRDLAQIVDQVAGKLGSLAKPQDPAHRRWTEEVGAFLDDLAKRGLKTRLDEAARELRLKSPIDWGRPELEGLARALLQTDVIEADAQGQPRYPLLRAMGSLVPGDPQQRQREAAEQTLCMQVQPLSAPPGAAVAVGSARGAAGGQPATPVMLRAENQRLAELAIRRATCNDVWVRQLTGVVGETAAIPANVVQAAERAARSGKRCFVVATLHPLAGDDLDALAQDLARQLPSTSALVGVIGRDPSAAPAPPGDTIVVVVPEADEAAALVVADDLDVLSGKP